MRNWDNSNSRATFNLREVTLLDVTEILSQLSNTNTMGHDKMDPLTLKLIANTITKPIQHILNTSIATNTYCNKWKLGKAFASIQRRRGR